MVSELYLKKPAKIKLKKNVFLLFVCSEVFLELQ